MQSYQTAIVPILDETESEGTSLSSVMFTNIY